MDRLEFLYKKHVECGTLSESIFYRYLKNDPTASFKNGHIIRAGKYSEWLITRYYVEIFPLEGLEDIIFKFDKLKPFLKEKDVNKYTVRGLREIVEQHWDEKLLFTKNDWKEKLKRDDVKYIYEDDEFDVVAPHNAEASYEIAGSPLTNWCTALKTNSYFKNYTYPLYIIRDKNQIINYGKGKGEPRPMYQFHFGKFLFCNHKNEEIDVVNFLNANSKLKEFFKNEFRYILDTTDFYDQKAILEISSRLYGTDFIKDNLWKGIKWHIKNEYPKLFISEFLFSFSMAFNIFGYEKILDLVFKKANKNIEELDIDLLRYDEDGYNIPTTIERFKNLKILRLEGFVKKIPKSISELEKLSVVSLFRNKLKTIPATIKNNKSLEIIDIRETDIDPTTLKTKKNVYIKHGKVN